MNRFMRILSLTLALLLLFASCLAEETVRPQDDFYDAVNGAWIASAEIPADQPVIGGFIDLNDEIQDVLMADFARMLSGEIKPESENLSNFIEFYRLAADFETRDALGVEPLRPYMEKIEALDSLSELAAQWAQWDLQCMPLPFAAAAAPDMGNASTNALFIQMPSLLLMDKSYYADESLKAMLQSAFGQMSINLMVMAGKTVDEAQSIVSQALAFDELLVPYARSSEEASDYTKLYNPTDFAAFDAQVAGFDFASGFESLLGEVPETIVLTDPAYFAAMDEVVNEETFPLLKSWMMLSTVVGFSNYLSEDFRIESGSFNRMLTGAAEAAPREEVAYALASATFSEVVGVYYGETYFGAQARQDVRDMVERLVKIYEERLSRNEWLSDDTREMAIRKLQAMRINVGYPDEAQAVYGLLRTVPASEGGTLVENAVAFAKVIKADNYAKWNQPVDRGQWPLSADTVNAMYSPTSNSINFPAAILQAPFYSLDQSASANYGGIGAVIAHEISHAFDPNGAKFDEQGSLADWWSAEDYAQFEALSQAMIDEFDGVAHGGGSVNGRQTMAENVADAGGLSCAVEAALAEDDADLAALFTNWAVIWRQKATPEYESLLLTMDVHAPNKLRCNIQLQNMDGFYEAFDVHEGDAMYRAPEDRVNIW